jgi:hypothetical protein
MRRERESGDGRAVIRWNEPLFWFVVTFAAAHIAVTLWFVLKPLVRWWREHVRIIGRRG